MTGNMPVQPHVVAVRQICDDSAAIECWRLEKLALEDKILLDRGQAL